MRHKKKQKVWLYKKYKLDHPELFPATSNKKRQMRLSDKAVERLSIVVIVLLINVIAIMIAALLNADIRSLIF